MDPRLFPLVLTIAYWISGAVCIALSRQAAGGRWLERLPQTSAGATGREVVAFLYCVAGPALFLISGLLSRETVGLPVGSDGFTADEWLVGAGQAGAAAAATLLSLWIGPRAMGATLPRPGFAALRDAIYLEPLWALLRAAPGLALADAYGGAAVGVILSIGLLAILGRFGPPRTPNVLGRLSVDLACVLVSTFVFLATRNGLLCVTAHAVVRLGGAAFGRASYNPSA